MKKPVKPTAKIIDEAVANRKTLKRTEIKSVRRGNIDDVIRGAEEFAEANGVDIEDVKFQAQYYSGLHMTVRREETQVEKRRRIADDLNRKYRSKLYEFQNWERQQAYAAQQAARVITVPKVVCCKRCGCSCCS